MNITEAMIIDIDNCLVDSREQGKHLPAQYATREEWTNFQINYSHLYKRHPIIEGIIWDNIMLNGYYPIFVTAREDINGLREITENLIRDIFGETNHLLFMRKANDYRTDVEVKEDLYVEVEMCCDKVVLAFDDKTEICELWQSKGIPTLQFRFGG